MNDWLSIDEMTDTHLSTRASRMTIGFKPREAWQDASAQFDLHSLTIQGHPVMEDWEDNYMKELARIACINRGTILEIGFGMGISASYIQQQQIEKHIIIEANRDVFKKLLLFAENAEHPVIPVFGFWEECTKDIPSGSITGILFDTYPLTKEDIHQNHFPFFIEANRLLVSGGILTYYSDEVSTYSPKHKAVLKDAGFNKIEGSVCKVTPPVDCVYWNSPTILAPIIRK